MFIPFASSSSSAATAAGTQAETTVRPMTPGLLGLEALLHPNFMTQSTMVTRASPQKFLATGTSTTTMSLEARGTEQYVSNMPLSALQQCANGNDAVCGTGTLTVQPTRIQSSAEWPSTDPEYLSEPYADNGDQVQSGGVYTNDADPEAQGSAYTSDYVSAYQGTQYPSTVDPGYQTGRHVKDSSPTARGDPYTSGINSADPDETPYLEGGMTQYAAEATASQTGALVEPTSIGDVSEPTLTGDDGEPTVTGDVGEPTPNGRKASSTGTIQPLSTLASLSTWAGANCEKEGAELTSGFIRPPQDTVALHVSMTDHPALEMCYNVFDTGSYRANFDKSYCKVGIWPSSGCSGDQIDGGQLEGQCVNLEFASFSVVCEFDPSDHQIAWDAQNATIKPVGELPIGGGWWIKDRDSIYRWHDSKFDRPGS